MPLRPQDIVVVLKVITLPASSEDRVSYADLGAAVHMSPSQTHSSVRRAIQAGLLSVEKRPLRDSLLEFLIHGVRYAFYPERGGLTRGMPTAHAALPLSESIVSDGVPPVWPDSQGTVRGETLVPLHREAPAAARQDPELYELLALVDALRIGRARERKMAAELLRERFRA
jgi:hypothetical protein